MISPAITCAEALQEKNLIQWSDNATLEDQRARALGLSSSGPNEPSLAGHLSVRGKNLSQQKRGSSDISAVLMVVQSVSAP